jgi:hypothetical protein
MLENSISYEVARFLIKTSDDLIRNLGHYVSPNAVCNQFHFNYVPFVIS